MDFLLTFDDLKAGNNALKKLVQAFTRAGAPVATTDVDPKTKRSSGVSYRVVHMGFVDNQTIQLHVTSSGDIAQVKLNGSAVPIKNQNDQRKAVGELVALLEAGRAKFQEALAQKPAALPKTIKTAAPKMEAALQERLQAVEAQLGEAKAELEELKSAGMEQAHQGH